MRLTWLAVIGALVISATLAYGDSKPSDSTMAKATFAGGCFWCVESDFDKVEGVISTTSGFIGGKEHNPSYKDVAYGKTSHTEAVEIVYDPKKVTYQQLLDTFWVTHDPTVNDRQFCDTGAHYRPGIFYHNDEQKQLAEASKKKLEAEKPFQGMILTEVTKATTFYPAEQYHQDYYKKNPIRYKYYRFSCGRDRRLKELWGDRAKTHG